ncbi:hypothetical protein LINGRAHAP2_LOCUS24316 [Linum grandiflorum]
MVARFKELRARDWEIHIEHIYWKANSVADHLVHLDHSFSLSVHVLKALSTDLLNWILHDQLSSSQSRLVPI